MQGLSLMPAVLVLNVQLNMPVSMLQHSALSLLQECTKSALSCHDILCTCAQGSATLSMAYAAALFADAVLRGLNGATATECAYVDSNVTDVPFFASKVKLGTEGEWTGDMTLISTCEWLFVASVAQRQVMCRLGGLLTGPQLVKVFC